MLRAKDRDRENRRAGLKRKAANAAVGRCKGPAADPCPLGKDDHGAPTLEDPA